jgi:FkbM family methyltransferase
MQLDFFLKSVKSGDFALDIGAHQGQYAVFLSSLVGSMGKVISFEPDIAARSILKRNLKLNPCCSNVRVEEIALSDTSGTHPFYSRGGDSMSSLARSGLGSNSQSPGVTESMVTTMQLDDYLAKNELKNPDWIKLDTEGAEINILRGAKEVLKSGTKIVCELHPYAWNEFGTSFEELISIVNKCGRSIQYLDEIHRIENGPVYGVAFID